MTTSTASDTHLCITVRVADVATGELISAEVFDAGVEGIEEREASEGIVLLLYAPIETAQRVRNAVDRVAPAAEIGPVETVRAADWSEQWKRGLKAAEISPRLRVRPSFVESAPASGQLELIVDPGQAFGTGGHASTHLALEWIDAIATEREPGWRLLDVGTGTGVLAVASLRLGAGAAVAFDLDPLALEATRANARNNGVGRELAAFCGPLDAVAPVGFDVVVANLLRTEMMPLIGGIARRLAADGQVVLSGLLQSECPAVTARAAEAGLRCAGERSRPDANGDVWTALLMTG
jgi:ribosomal protein L11 methyltransferase